MLGQAGRRRPLELWAALVIAASFHGGLLLSGSYRHTFDAYVHLFFADHYRRSWFSSWEPRWYTGFTTVSYPPGSHQLLALAAKVIGLDNAFPLVALGAVLVLVVGVFRFATIWVSPRAAGYAALLVALSSSIAEALQVFGQLPTILSLGFLLNSLPFVHRWIRDGGIGAFVGGLTCSAATTAAHHVTTLFGAVFFLGPVVVHALIDRLRSPLGDEPPGHPVRLRHGQFRALAARRLRRVLPAGLRTTIYLTCMLGSLVLVVLPYWLWSASDPIAQIPIPHASRESFIANPNAGLLFFVIPWGVLLITLPYALSRGLASKAWPLAASVGLLTLLGTGGTTPLPKILLGGAYNVLTLDRFALWATIAVLPLSGQFVESAIHGRVRSAIRAQFGNVLYLVFGVAVAASFVVAALFAANLSSYRSLQPTTVDPQPIVSFLDKDQHDRWRYLTLGLGDQMAWLAAQTTAETVDGNYHSARRLPELTSTPVERLEGAKYTGVAGLGSLQQFLAYPEKYHLKYVFSNDHFYDPLLSASGWQHLEPLSNSVDVWQRDDVTPLPAGRIRPELPLRERLMWGIIPPLAMISALIALGLYALGGHWPSALRPAVPRIVLALWRRVDERLANNQQFIAVQGDPPTWKSWHRVLVGAANRGLRPAQGRREHVQIGVVVFVLVGATAWWTNQATERPSPRATVYAYFDALDLRKLKNAYELLDPETRPTYQQFATERSVVNGLMASYARLTRIDTSVVKIRGDRATVRADLHYLTALDDHPVTVEQTLKLVHGRWRVIPIPSDLRVPPDQIVSRPSLDFLSQGRRQVADGPTAYQDVIDRPELQISSARLVRHNGQLSVVGEALNVDSDPAYLTVTATLVGHDGRVLSAFTNGVGSAHTMLPGEVVPFRVDFEAVAGLEEPGADLQFAPGARTPLRIAPADIAEVRIAAKALVTTLDLGRSVVAQAIQPSTGGQLTIVLRNDGLEEATIPHVFVTLRTADGRVGWVDDMFPPEGLRPQRSARVQIALTPADDIEPIDVPIRVFSNSLSSPLKTPRDPLVNAISGWRGGADIAVFSFTRIVG